MFTKAGVIGFTNFSDLIGLAVHKHYEDYYLWSGSEAGAPGCFKNGNS